MEKCNLLDPLPLVLLKGLKKRKKSEVQTQIGKRTEKASSISWNLLPPGAACFFVQRRFATELLCNVINTCPTGFAGSQFIFTKASHPELFRHDASPDQGSCLPHGHVQGVRASHPL